MSQAMPTRSGGAGTPAAAGAGEGLGGGDRACARCAWEASALPMRSRPGGTFEVVVTLSRSCLAVVLLQRPGEAAGGGCLVVAGVAGAGDRRGQGLVAEGVAGCLARAVPGVFLLLACLRRAGRGGWRRGEVRLDGVADRLDRLADRVQQVRDAGLGRGGRGGVGVEAEDAAPAAGQPGQGAGVAVGGLVGLAPGGPQPGQGDRADGRLDLGGDRGGSAGSRMPASSRARIRAAASRPRGGQRGPRRRR